MDINDKQVGGKHYKCNYQHWDLVCDLGLNYLEGCITKYVARWRKKNGIEDLHKAVHYLEKLISIEEGVDRWSIQENITWRWATNGNVLWGKHDHFINDQRFIDKVELFCEENQLNEAESHVTRLIVLRNDVGNLKKAMEFIKDGINAMEAEVDDSGQKSPFGYTEDQE